MTFKQGLLVLMALKMVWAAPRAYAQDAALLPVAATGKATPGKAAPGKAMMTAQQPRVLVRQIKFSGNTVIKDEELNRIVGPQQGKELSLADLQALAARVTAYYDERGYFLAKVVVPEQEIAGGVVTMRVLEGRLGEIIVHGTRRYREAYVRKTFSRVRSEKVIRDRKSTRLNSSHIQKSRMPSSA